MQDLGRSDLHRLGPMHEKQYGGIFWTHLLHLHVSAAPCHFTVMVQSWQRMSCFITCAKLLSGSLFPKIGAGLVSFFQGPWPRESGD